MKCLCGRRLVTEVQTFRNNKIKIHIEVCKTCGCLVSHNIISVIKGV